MVKTKQAFFAHHQSQTELVDEINYSVKILLRGVSAGASLECFAGFLGIVCSHYQKLFPFHTISKYLLLVYLNIIYIDLFVTHSMKYQDLGKFTGHGIFFVHHLRFSRSLCHMHVCLLCISSPCLFVLDSTSSASLKNHQTEEALF